MDPPPHPEVNNTMNHDDERREVLVERLVTYTLEVNGRFCIVQDVPARVNLHTGEQLFSPQTVERLQQLIHGDVQPVRVVETPVFQFAP